jgi:8-oxo-dGTP diphosphatase
MSSLQQITNMDRYKVVPRTLIFIFDDKERVLLIKGSPDKKLWSGFLNGIGGHIEAGEDIYESAIRELYEETGLSGIPLNYCGQIMINVKDDSGVSLFVFRGQYTGEISGSSKEGEISWIEIDALENEPVVEDLPLLIPRIHRAKMGDPIIIGKYDYDQDGNLRVSLR